MITAETVGEYPTSLSGQLNLRTATAGPEYELVLEYVAAHLPEAPRGQARTLFLEPEIESGFPDVVAVYWHVATARRWNTARAVLTKADVRIAHFLATMGTADLERLRPFYPSRLRDSLERLEAACVVRKTGAGWRLRSMQDIFAVRRLVAIEAKVSAWEDGLQQAFQNTWFASESFLLLPHLPRVPVLLEEAERFGVGVRVAGQHLDSDGLCPRLAQIPRSYASWLFNEWVWRAEVAE